MRVKVYVCSMGLSLLLVLLPVATAAGLYSPVELLPASKPTIREFTGVTETGQLVTTTDAALKQPVNTSDALLLASSSDNRWDSQFGVPGADGVVRDLVYDSRGYLYAGGDFSAIGGTTTDGVACWHDGSWEKLSNYTDGSVSALTAYVTNVYAGGNFTHIGDIGANRVAKWNGVTWSSLGSGLNGTVRALAVDKDGILYAGGFFTSTSEGVLSLLYIAKWNGVTWSAVGAGLNGAVYALAFDANGNLFAGGQFTATAAPDSQTVNHVARWDGKDWYPLEEGVNSHVYTLAAMGSTLWIGGAFTEMIEGSVGYIARWDDGKWSSLGGGLNNSVAALVVSGTEVYAGGYFTSIASGHSANRIAVWNGSTWSALGSGTNDVVETLAFGPSQDLIAGGYFTQAGGKSSSYIARWQRARINLPLVLRNYLYTPLPPPAPPSDLTAVTLSDTRIELSWTDNSSNESEFIIENSSDGVAFTEYGTSDGPNITVVWDDALPPGTRFCYRVLARNANGDSNPSNTACATTTSHVAPLAPSNVTAQVISSTQILLTWVNNSSCDGYNIRESVDGGPFSAPYQVTPSGMLQGAYVGGLTPGHSYRYEVRAFNSIGPSPFSNPSASVSTPASTASSVTRFVNNTVYPVVSLKIDGVEQFPSAPMGLPPNTYYQKELSLTTHSYRATTGFWSGNSRVEMYVFQGSFTQGNGVAGQVTFNNPTISQMLTRFGTSGYYVGEYWVGTIIHSAAFRFKSGGTYDFYRDGIYQGSGSYSIVTYGGNYLVTFQVTGYQSAQGYMDERTGSFYMRNGPTDWPSIQYSYDGS